MSVILGDVYKYQDLTETYILVTTIRPEDGKFDGWMCGSARTANEGRRRAETHKNNRWFDPVTGVPDYDELYKLDMSVNHRDDLPAVPKEPAKDLWVL